MTAAYALRPFVPADAAELRELYAQSIEELCVEEYDDDQRLAWASRAEDATAFGARLAGMVTLVIQVESDYAGYAALADNTVLDMLYVHPHYAREGVGTTLADAIERLAAGRGSIEITVEASDTAVPFFQARGYVGTQRNAIPIDDQWLTSTTMTKQLVKAGAGS